MYVLIKTNHDGNQRVWPITTDLSARMKEEAIQKADDVIRAEMVAVDYSGDIQYGSADHPLEPDHPFGLIGTWVTDQEAYELWMAWPVGWENK